MLHLHFLRALARSRPQDTFVHQAQAQQLGQLQEMVEDVPNIQLRPLTASPAGVNAWKDRGRGSPTGGFWERHPLKNNFCEFYLEWFRGLAGELGGVSPFTKPEDLLFDYPAIQRPSLNRDLDFLILNSTAGSGQTKACAAPFCFDPLIAKIARRHRRVICTSPTKVPGVICTLDGRLSLTQIGSLSLRTETIFGTSSGPSWPTFNIWNKESVELRLLMLDKERLDGLSPNLVQTDSFTGAEKILQERGLL
jgi:hypothetical protein